MIRSMTGYGRAECDENGTKVTVEVHSVNSRFLDIKMKLPRFLYEYESELRKIVQKYIERGRVSLAISIDQPAARVNNMSVDFELAGKYVRLAEEIARRYDINNRIDARVLLTMPDVLKCDENESDAAQKWNITKKAVISALEAQRNMREKEGGAIGGDVSERLAVVNGYIKDVEKMTPEIVENNTSKLRNKIENLLDAGKFDENRFAMEVAMYADRVDVTEECVRLKSHCDQFGKEITGKKTSGKKLSFLLQEINREVNTIASKAMNARISQLIVQIKEELEKMREQAENLE